VKERIATAPLCSSSVSHFADEFQEIHTEEDLELYCRRAGGSVGIMLARLLGSSGPEGETKMATLGRAMQRTNILRDIDEDAAHGRVYLSRSTIERFGAPTPGAHATIAERHHHGARIHIDVPLVPSLPEAPDVSVVRTHATLGPRGLTYYEHVLP
jgi:Squalene/phytoene synthase